LRSNECPSIVIIIIIIIIIIMGSMKDSIHNHRLYFVLPSSCTLIPEISKGYRVRVRFSFSCTDSIVEICVHVHILRIMFFMCPFITVLLLLLLLLLLLT